MSHRYTAVSWTRHKKIYDAAIASSVAIYLGVFIGVTAAAADAAPDPAVMLMRALGSAAIVMLHVILCIGPLCRISNRFAPLLYNRRHLGVAMSIAACLHAVVATMYYGAFGVNPNPLAQVLGAGRSFASIGAFPFELLGFVALCWILLMAVTSHDYWLKLLSPRWWKILHMGVYASYAFVLGHVALGSMRDDGSLVTPFLLGIGVLAVGGLHAWAGLRELASDSAALNAGDASEWIRACGVRDVAEGKGKVVSVGGAERIAIFRHGGKLSAMSNVCAHQMGPLGEGAIVDGCVTCPWHGWQYRPEDGCSPPPFEERVPTYNVRIEGHDVMIDPRPNEPGTRVEPAIIPVDIDDEGPLFEDPGTAQLQDDQQTSPSGGDR